MTTSFDPIAFKRTTRAQWEEAAEAWHRWGPTIEDWLGDATGARWGLAGAEAILKLRALRSNGDFETYWTWHLTQERHRIHQSRYLDGALPRAA